MYKFAIIGAGQIASGYDNPGDDRVLTHAHAISLHSDAALLGFYDTDMLASERASKKWGGESYVSLDHMMAKKPDVVIICTPDGEHFQALKYLLKSPPKLFCVKNRSPWNVRQASILWPHIRKLGYVWRLIISVASIM